MRIKDVVNLCNVKTDDHSKPYVALENIESWNSKFIPSESVSEGMNNVFDAGDILFGKLRPYLAKAYIPNFDGICSTEFFVLKPKKGFDSRYLLYRLLMPSFIWYINSRVTGVKMPRTNWNDFSNVEIDIPSLPVQRRIVSYLDSKTSEIDHAISLLEQKREAYTRLKASVINRAVTRGLNPNVKLKDSGVEWIGKIPEGWKVRRIKDITSDVFMGKTPEYTLEDNENYILGQKNNQTDGITFEGIKFGTDDFFRSRASYEFLQYHDVLLNTLGGGSVGRVGLYDYEGSRHVITDGHLMILRCKEYDPRILYYFLYTKRRELEQMAIGSTNQAFFNVSDINILQVPVPPLSEQRSIASYLDAECSKIDRAASIVEKQIDAYKRLKRSLINEVVTGKRTKF